MSDAFGFSSAEYESAATDWFGSVDDSGDLAPYDFSALECRARYNGLPEHVKLSLEGLLAHADAWAIEPSLLLPSTAYIAHIAEYLGAL